MGNSPSPMPLSRAKLVFRTAIHTQAAAEAQYETCDPTSRRKNLGSLAFATHAVGKAAEAFAVLLDGAPGHHTGVTKAQTRARSAKGTPP